MKNWQSPSRDPWSNCLINSREDDKGQSYYYSGRQKDNSKTICRRAGYMKIGEDLYCKVFPKVTASRTHAKFATWTSGSFESRSEIKANKARSRRKLVARISGTRRKHPGESQRWKYRENCRGNVDYSIPSTLHSTIQKEDSNRRETAKIDSTVRESPEPWPVHIGFEQDWGIESVQRKVEGVDHQHG